MSSTNVYSRNIDGSLGVVKVDTSDHKEAILSVKEYLVATGDCLTNKAVLALILGGKK